MWRTGAALLLLLPALAACESPATEDGGTLKPLHGQITPDMLVAPAAQNNASEIAALEATEGVWQSEGVIDTQTLVLVSDDMSVRIRLAGITTPTGDECLAGLALDTLRFIVGGRRPLALDANLEGRTSDVRPGYVETIDGDDLGAVMIRLGLAEIDTATIDDDHRAGYDAELEAAQDEQVGVWAEGACDE